MAISMLKIRRSLGRLIFNMGIAIPGKTVFLIETAPQGASSLYSLGFVLPRSPSTVGFITVLTWIHPAQIPEYSGLHHCTHLDSSCPDPRVQWASSLYSLGFVLPRPPSTVGFITVLTWIHPAQIPEYSGLHHCTHLDSSCPDPRVQWASSLYSLGFILPRSPSTVGFITVLTWIYPAQTPEYSGLHHCTLLDSSCPDPRVQWASSQYSLGFVLPRSPSTVGFITVLTWIRPAQTPEYSGLHHCTHLDSSCPDPRVQWASSLYSLGFILPRSPSTVGFITVLTWIYPAQTPEYSGFNLPPLLSWPPDGVHGVTRAPFANSMPDIFYHDDVIKWKHFPRYWPFVRGIHWSLVNFLHKGQWRGALMFFFCVWINGWANNREAGDLRRYHAHYDVP